MQSLVFMDRVRTVIIAVAGLGLLALLTVGVADTFGFLVADGPAPASLVR